MLFEGAEWWRCLQVIVAAILFQFTTQTHFRGAQFWFTPLPEEGEYVVDIHFRIAWRRNSSGSTYCDDSIIESGKLLGPPTAGNLLCDVGSCRGDSITNLRFHCTDYSVVEDWTVGVNNRTYRFRSPGDYELIWKGEGWLDGAVHAHDAKWELRMFMNLDPRPDNGRINSSPKSAVSPIIRMQDNCQHALRIPVSDDDDDIVRCRWAEKRRDECGEICDAFKNAYLEESTCTLRYAAADDPGSYAVAIQLEDYIDEASEEPLSSVPVQFIIFVYPSDQRCDEAPQFIDPTPEAGSCITFDVDTTYTSQVVVRSKDQFTPIQEISTVSSVGMRKSEVRPYQDDPRDYYVDITWTPREVGEVIFCFTARDVNSISTEQRCIYLLIGMPPLLATRAETEEIGDTVEVYVHFNQQIQRPSLTHYMSVHSEDDDEIVVELDTTNTTTVIFDNLFVMFNATIDMEVGRGYYILMPEGAVRGTRRCGADSVEISTPSTLAFTMPGYLSTLPSSEGTTSAYVTAAETPGDSSTQTFETTNDNTGVITERPPAPLKDDDDDDNYLWLILVIMLVILLVTLIAILVGLVLARKKYKRENRKSPQDTNDEFIRHLQNMGVYNNSYQTEAIDPDVKIR